MAKRRNSIMDGVEKKYTISQYFNIENITGHPRMKEVFVKYFKNEGEKTIKDWSRIVKTLIK